MTDSIFHQNYEADFLLRFRFTEQRPEHPWTLVFFTSKYDKYVVSFDGENYRNASPEAENADYIQIVFNDHLLTCGVLQYKLYEDVPDAFFPDGVRKTVLPVRMPFELWAGASDDVPLTPEFEAVTMRALQGYTPYVGTNGNWWINGEDTGKPAVIPPDLVHTPGDREDAAMSQKGVTELAAATLATANEYTADQIAAIPVPDVSGQIATHNASEDAHADIRELLRGAVGLPVFDPATYTLTFTAQNGATAVVDLPLEVMGLDYEPATKEMIYTAADGAKRRIPLVDFVDVYVGSIGSEIQITVDAGNVIRAKQLTGSVVMEHLSAALQAMIRNKADAIPGKSLSTNDYTDPEKAEVAKIKGKEDAQIIETIPGTAVTLDVAGGHTYLCGELSSLTLTSVEESAREAVIRFRSGAVATTLSIPDTLQVVGYAVPATNVSYEISIASNRAVIAWF